MPQFPQQRSYARQSPPATSNSREPRFLERVGNACRVRRIAPTFPRRLGQAAYRASPQANNGTPMRCASRVSRVSDPLGGGISQAARSLRPTSARVGPTHRRLLREVHPRGIAFVVVVAKEATPLRGRTREGSVRNAGRGKRKSARIPKTPSTGGPSTRRRPRPPARAATVA